MHSKARRDSLTAQALLLGSGISALVYQTLWVKQLSLVVGVDVYAVTTGVSAFFAGLALGGALFGRLADRVDSPLRLYAALELAIALAGLLSTLALARSAALFVALESSLGMLAWVLPFLLVALPAVLMGGTLPPLLAAIKPGDDLVGRSAGQLYAANTAGAIIGVLLCAFLLIPVFGVTGAAIVAALLNALLGVVAMWYARRQAPDQQRSAALQAGPEVARLSTDARLALTLYALAGGVALGYEVLWTQAIVQFLSTRAIAFSVVLATYLTGLVAGSYLYARVADRITARWTLFGSLILGAGLVALVTFAALGPWLAEAQQSLGSHVYTLTGSRMAEMCARFVLAAAVLILPSTLLLGAAFPASARLVVDVARPGQDIGRVLALNTACGIAGTLLTGFMLVPRLGLANSLAVLASVAAVIGAVAMARDTRGAVPVPALGLGAVVLLLAVYVPKDGLSRMLVQARGGELVFYDEGPAGTVAVLEQQSSRGSFRRLYIQGVSNTGDALPSLRYMRLQSLLPLLVHPGEPRSVAVVGLGTGITSGALLAYPNLERRLCIELMQPVVDAVSLFRGNLGAGQDARLEVRVADGRHELMREQERFDLITLEPPPPAAAGVVNLYSSDFYRLAQSRLNEDGLLAQWLPIATQNDSDTRSLVRAMLDVFPHLTLWTTEANEMLLLGAAQPLDLDYARIEQRFRTGEVAVALEEVGILSTADLLATYVTDRTGLEQYAGTAPPVTDDRPRIEYAAWLHAEEITRVLPVLLELRSAPPVKADAAEKARIEASYQRLIDFYQIYLFATMGDRERWGRSVRGFRRDSSANAYYDWFLSQASEPR